MLEPNLSSASHVLERLNLCPINQRLARYWLSICQDGSFPFRSDFNPKHIKTNLPGLAIFDVHQCGTVVARISGTAIDRGLGFSLVGQDFISFLPDDQKSLRVQRLHRVVNGFVGVARTAFRPYGKQEAIMENLLLPFGDISETGSRQFLLHTNVRPELGDLIERPESWNAGLPERYDEIPLY